MNVRGSVALALALVLVAGCGGRPTVQKGAEIDAMDIDLTGVWNDKDAARVARELINDCLTHPWLSRYMQSHTTEPVVVVGNIRKNLSEHVDTSTVTTQFERALLDDGRVGLVARSDQRDDIAGEIDWQNLTASPETMKAFGQAYGADLILLGEMRDIVDRVRDEKVVTYQLDFELIDIESQRKYWIGQTSLKKFITR